MMTKLNLPKLWLYIAFAIVVPLLVLSACSSDLKDAESTETTPQDNQGNNVSVEYTITYAPGSFAQGAREVVIKKPSETVVLKDVPFKRYGFTLSGWQEVEGSDAFYPIGYEFTEDRSITLYPVWKINTYDVIFEPGVEGAGTPIKASKIHATAFTLPGQVFTREGYTQTGWSLVAGGEKVFGLSGEYVEDLPVTLFAVWEKNSYTVEVLPDKDAKGEALSQTLFFGDTYRLPDAIFTKNDYDLVGWAITEGGLVKYQLSEQITVSESLKLYPVWELTKTYDITPDFKKLPRTLLTTMSVADLALYFKLVNAYMDHQSSVSFTTDTNPALVLDILKCYFPVMFADITPDGVWVSTSDNTIRFNYLSEETDDHNQRIAEFGDALKKYLSGFNRTDTDAERALLLYQRLIENMTYDYDLDTDSFDTNLMMQSAYYAIMNGSGRSDSLARAYAFLLTQADVDAVTVNSYVAGAQVDHYWVAIILDSKWYYTDVSLDLPEKTLTHFGMSDSEMTALGYKDAKNDAISAYTGNNIKDLIDTLDTRFHVLHSGAYSPVIDRDLDKIIFKDAQGNEIVFDMVTKVS